MGLRYTDSRSPQGRGAGITPSVGTLEAADAAAEAMSGGGGGTRVFPAQPLRAAPPAAALAAAAPAASFLPDADRCMAAMPAPVGADVVRASCAAIVCTPGTLLASGRLR